jgi:putative ribosome biogenesis GTPase RsgA
MDIVIFQGFSGVGKSSMILTLSGQKMIYYNNPIDKNRIIRTKDKSGLKGVKI